MHEFNEFFHVRFPSDNLRRASRIAVQGLVLSRVAVAEFLKFLASASHTEKEGRGGGVGPRGKSSTATRLNCKWLQRFCSVRPDEAFPRSAAASCQLMRASVCAFRLVIRRSRWQPLKAAESFLYNRTLILFLFVWDSKKRGITACDVLDGPRRASP